MESSPGRVFTAPGTNTTSPQSGEAPAGRSAGATSVTRPPNISSDASAVPSTLMPFPWSSSTVDPLFALHGNPRLNQFAERRFDLNVGVAGDARGIGARGQFGIGGGVDLYLAVRQRRRTGANEGVSVSRRAAHPHLHRRLARADLAGDGREIQRVSARAVASRWRQRAEDVEIISAEIDACN